MRRRKPRILGVRTSLLRSHNELPVIILSLTLHIGALFSLKRKKMLEKEVAKLDGQMTLLEQ